MLLTRAADYAIRVMIQLAARSPGIRASSAELGVAYDCPDQFLSKMRQVALRLAW